MRKVTELTDKVRILRKMSIDCRESANKTKDQTRADFLEEEASRLDGLADFGDWMLGKDVEFV